jgi:hypothetical protein
MYRILDALLAPIARLLVARGVLIAEVTERMKLHYVRAARAQAGPKPTDSRISVMTGLQRREVARLLAVDLDAPELAPRPVNHLSRLVALWLTDPQFDGRPLPRSGGTISFEGLAQSIRRDVHPRTMLEQLILAGTVKLDAQDRVHLRQQSYQPLAGSDDQLAYFADNAGDFLTAATQNILSDPAPFFERAVHYNGLTLDAVAELDGIYRVGQMELLVKLSIEAARLSSTPGPKRFRAGGYFFAKDQD